MAASRRASARSSARTSSTREGQLLTARFLDYAMPRASDFSDILVEEQPGADRTNPLGVKGAGEAGTVGALPALVGAVVDALRPHGVDASRHAADAGTRLGGAAGTLAA